MLIGARCPACGGPVEDPRSDNCSYCGIYLVRLSAFETTAQRRSDGTHFRSFAPLYWLAVAGSFVSATLIYLVFFDSFSETQLVRVSPVWFLLGVLGTGGLVRERAVRLVLEGKADTFVQAQQRAADDLPPIIQGLGSIALLPSLLILPRRLLMSPLLVATVTMTSWATVLYVFLIGIFPSL